MERKPSRRFIYWAGWQSCDSDRGPDDEVPRIGFAHARACRRFCSDSEYTMGGVLPWCKSPLQALVSRHARRCLPPLFLPAAGAYTARPHLHQRRLISTYICVGSTPAMHPPALSHPHRRIQCPSYANRNANVLDLLHYCSTDADFLDELTLTMRKKVWCHRNESWL